MPRTDPSRATQIGEERVYSSAARKDVRSSGSASRVSVVTTSFERS